MKNSLNNDQQDDLREWVYWSFTFSVLSIILTALTWIFKK